LLLCLLLLGSFALATAGGASAGYGVSPNGQSYPVMLDTIGYLTDPKSLDLVVYLDAQDSDVWVWVSETPQIGSYGIPVGGSIGSCSAGSLLPFGEPNKWVCRVSTILMKPGRTYYWWLDFRRREEGANSPEDRISGPFSFSLAQAAAPAPPPVEEPTYEDPPYEDPHDSASTKTVASAATLPSLARFDGSRSIKHTTLTQLVYRTMRQLGLPRQLAFACWNRTDWLSVVQAGGMEPEAGSQLLGFWLGRQPRWLHLAPGVCTDVQALLSTRRPNARRAGALTTVIHETLHAYGVRNEAQTNCWAVQLVPVFGRNLGLNATQVSYLGTLARSYTRMYAPAGYWSYANCRDGAGWDLFPSSRNLG
jgi:hypothetical protein